MSSAPPAAKQVPAARTHHGDSVIDCYAWLADRNDPDALAYLKAENDYAEAAASGLRALRDQIFAEIKARTQESDLSVPVRKGGWWTYARTVEGQQYPVHCRRAVRPGEVLPPAAADGGPLDGEEVLLDCNELAAGAGFFALGAYRPSPDWRLLGYSADFAGDERFTIRIKDLAAGEVLPDEIPGAYYGCAWSLDGSTLFYVTVDDAWRPYRVWRHKVGTPAAADVVVFEEPDERFHVRVGQTRSERYLVIRTASVLTSEVWLCEAAAPDGAFTVVAPRRHGVDYDVEHAGDQLLILHNDGAENFEIAAAPVTDPARWTPLVRHRPEVRLLSVDAFADHLVVHFRRDGLTGLRILGRRDRDGHGEYGPGAGREVAFPEPVYRVAPGPNPEFTSGRYRLSYTSFVTPGSVYDCDMATGELTLLKRQPVLAAPDGRQYRPEDYEQHREWATADDGTRVPISLVCRAGTPRDGSAPFLLYGYGAYEISRDPGFSIPVLSLLDRGFGYAIAHVRGGGEMGRPWYTGGKLLRKKNTFTDFIACARHLAARVDGSGQAGGPRRLGRRPADGRGGEHGAGGVRRDRRAGAVRGRAEHHPRPVAAADRHRVGGVGRPAARPAGVRVHEVVLAVRERDRAGVPADLRAGGPERHPGELPRARQVDRQAAGGRKGRAVPAEDRDGGGARRPQRALRRVAGGGARAGLDHPDGAGRYGGSRRHSLICFCTTSGAGRASTVNTYSLRRNRSSTGSVLSW